jgi:hypothetical protein
MQTLEDQAFAFILLGAMAVFWISIATVYLGEQVPQIAFLLIGWSQSIRSGALASPSAPLEAASSRFAFKRIFS